MAYEALSKDVIRLIGGTENIKAFTHCMTRLRFTLVDINRVDEQALKALDVLGVVLKGAQCQVIIGNDVTLVFEEILRQYPSLANEPQSTAVEQGGKRPNLARRILEHLSAILVETLPPVIGCGIIQGIRFLLMSFNYPSESNLMFMLTLMGSCTLYFYPFLLANSAAKRFGTNGYMAMGIAACMMYPTILNAAGEDPLKLFGIIDMPFINYSSTVIPIIVAVWVLKYVYDFFNRHTPAVVRIVLVPTLTMVVMLPLTMVLIAPLTSYLSDLLAIAIEWMFAVVPWFAGFFIGASRPLLVLVGMHHAVRPIQAQQIATFGYTTITPINYVSTLCQATAAFTAIFLCKNQRNKQVAISASISGFMGVTEPALYGIIFKFPAALAGTVIGGGVGGLICSVMGAKAYTFGVPNTFFTMPVFMGAGPLTLLIGLAAGMLTTALVTFVLAKTVFRLQEDVSFTDGKAEKKAMEKRG